MTHSLLFDTHVAHKQYVSCGAIRASFMKKRGNRYEVVLDVNSNKLLIEVDISDRWIESFEILAMKGFMDLTMSLVNLIKIVVQKIGIVVLSHN